MDPGLFRAHHRPQCRQNFPANSLPIIVPDSLRLVCSNIGNKVKFFLRLSMWRYSQACCSEVVEIERWFSNLNFGPISPLYLCDGVKRKLAIVMGFSETQVAFQSPC